MESIKKVSLQSWTDKDLKNSDQWVLNSCEILSSRDLILSELEEGSGVFLIRGLQISKLSLLEMKAFCIQMGEALGTPVYQDPQGSRVVDIRSTDADSEDALHYQLKANGKNTRPYETTVAFSFHTDPCDVAGLLCINPAKTGGASRIASAIALHDALLDKDPALLEALYQPFYYARPPRAGFPRAFHQIPVFSTFEGHFKSHIVSELIFAAQNNPEVPRLTSIQLKALNYLQTLASDPYFFHEIHLESGDFLLVNNHVVYHARTAYQEGSIKRHLLRLWLAVSNSRPLNPIHEAWFGSTKPGGVRGGYQLEAKQNLPS